MFSFVYFFIYSQTKLRIYLEDHPSGCKWFGSPPFISHEFMAMKGRVTTTPTLGDNNQGSSRLTSVLAAHRGRIQLTPRVDKFFKKKHGVFPKPRCFLLDSFWKGWESLQFTTRVDMMHPKYFPNCSKKGGGTWWNQPTHPKINWKKAGVWVRKMKNGLVADVKARFCLKRFG